MLAIVYLSCLSAKLTKGYCAPLLACPKKLPLAWLEIPRSSCTSQKVMLASIDNISWHDHGKTHLNCCSEEPNDRLKYAVVRHPYTRLLSMYNHHHFCDSARFEFCKRKLSTQNLNDFFQWTATTFNRIKGDRFDRTRHLRTQLSYFYDERMKSPYNISDFLILNMETIEKDFLTLEDKLCETYGRCNVHLNLTIVNKLNASGTHDLSLLRSNKTVLGIINQHFAVDFTVFGYKPFSTI